MPRVRHTANKLLGHDSDLDSDFGTTNFTNAPIDTADQTAVIAKLKHKLQQDTTYYTNRICLAFLLQTPLLIFTPTAVHRAVGGGLPVVSRVLSLLSFCSILLTCIDLRYDAAVLGDLFEDQVRGWRSLLVLVRAFLLGYRTMVFQRVSLLLVNVGLLLLVCASNWRYATLSALETSTLPLWVRGYYTLCVVDFFIGVCVKHWYAGLTLDLKDLERLTYEYKDA